ncbi:MAG: prephenate dehydrogenase [Methylocystaceae bacterium]|nr:prephenate dehydrogenase [Methylocystaceae bacterium]
MSNSLKINSIGLLGFGAFGRIIHHHIKDFCPVQVHDPHVEGSCDIKTVARCDLIILAVPVQQMAHTILQIKPFLRPGQIVLDVGSVKIKPVEVMTQHLPEFVEIIATHPLFGPQSAKDGVAGHKMVLCPVRGESWKALTVFLKRKLTLNVIVQSADQHDRDMALVQGMTHMVAQILHRLEPFPTELTTPSFDLMCQALEMVRDDSANVFQAIERDNPHAKTVRLQFFEMTKAVLAEIDQPDQTRSLAG